MKTSIVRTGLVGILMLGLAVPGVASAAFFDWGCRYQGTWFGVVSDTDDSFAGWMATIGGNSYFYGTNDLEFTREQFDPTTLPLPRAGEVVDWTSNRGNWMRSGYNTFIYTSTGFGLDANRNIVYIVRIGGTIELSEDCNSDRITVILEVFEAGANPFTDAPIFGPVPLPDTYGVRAHVDVPVFPSPQ